MSELRDTVACHLLPEELDQLLTGQPLAAETQQHLLSCEECCALADELAPAPFTADVPLAWRSKVRSAIGQNLEPSDPIGSDWRLATKLFLLNGILIALLVLWLGWRGWRFMDLPQRGALSASLVIAVSVATVSMIRQMIPGERKVPVWLVLSAVFALPTGVTILAFPWTLDPYFARMGSHCFKVGIIAAALGAPFFFLFTRTGVALSRPALGFTVGTLSGLVAIIVLKFYCPSTHAPHLLVWHCAPLLIAACTGWLIGELQSRRSTSRAR